MKRPDRILKAVLLAMLGIGCGAERTPVDEHRCSELRSHIIALQLRDVHVATGINIEAHRKALEAALGDDFVPSCLSKLDEVQVTCLLDAPDQAAAQACVPNPTESPRPLPAAKE